MREGRGTHDVLQRRDGTLKTDGAHKNESDHQKRKKRNKGHCSLGGDRERIEGDVGGDEQERLDLKDRKSPA